MNAASPIDTYPHLPHNTALDPEEIEPKGLLFSSSESFGAPDPEYDTAVGHQARTAAGRKGNTPQGY
mgnify:FL=1|jgi:hypothetical protein